jgi:DNA-binding response OmpR family regulator
MQMADTVLHRVAPASPGPGAWRLDRPQRRLGLPAGLSVPLVQAELVLLESLIAQAGRPLDRAHILQALKDGGAAIDDARLEKLVGDLRSKVLSHSPHLLPLKPAASRSYVFTGRAVLV